MSPRPSTSVRRLVAALALTALVGATASACGGDDSPAGQPSVDGGTPPDVVTAPPGPDGGLDAARDGTISSPAAACLDQPGLPRPPSGALSCDLLPPSMR